MQPEVKVCVSINVQCDVWKCGSSSYLVVKSSGSIGSSWNIHVVLKMYTSIGLFCHPFQFSMERKKAKEKRFRGLYYDIGGSYIQHQLISPLKIPRAIRVRTICI